MTSISAGHIMLTPTQPVGSERLEPGASMQLFLYTYKLNLIRIGSSNDSMISGNRNSSNSFIIISNRNDNNNSSNKITQWLRQHAQLGHCPYRKKLQPTVGIHYTAKNIHVISNKFVKEKRGEGVSSIKWNR